MKRPRQIPDLIVPSNVAGITKSASTVNTNNLVAPTGLAFDTSAVGAERTFTVGRAPVAGTGVGIGKTANILPSPTTQPQANASVSIISVGTVIAACLGAFAGACILIFIGVVIYRRSKPKPRHPVSRQRKQDAWKRLEEAGNGSKEMSYGDTREGYREPVHREPHPPNEVPTGMSSGLSVFHKPFHSMDKSSESNRFDLTQPLEHYHPELAAQLATTSAATPTPAEPPSSSYLPPPEDPFMEPLERPASGTFSPSLAARSYRTPPITPRHQSYHWQSAEVVQVEEDPFTDDHSTRPNSFFGEKEKSNPFEDSNAPPDRALQSLIAALERPSSMVDSIASAETVSAFPMPPTQIPR